MNLNRRAFLTTAAAALVATPAFSASQPYRIPRHHKARIVEIKDGLAPGEIHVDPGQFALYFTLRDRRAIRYPVGIGREERYVGGSFVIRRRAEWPSWTPTKAMIRRDPAAYAPFAGGMPGGADNPMGARALYLYRGSRDSLLRIHGTNQPEAVGTAQTNGCIRMINAHAIDLYQRAPNGTRVVLH